MKFRNILLNQYFYFLIIFRIKEDKNKLMNYLRLKDNRNKDAVDN